VRAGAPASPLRRPALALRQPTHCVLLAIARAGERLVACGEHGVVVLSENAGRTWRQAQVPVSVTLTSLAFADARAGWAVGHLGTVLRTDDGGQTWQHVFDGTRAPQPVTDPLMQVALRGDGSLVAVGAYGLALASRDGGRAWQSIAPGLPNPENYSLYGYVERGGEQWLFGEQGFMLRAEKGDFRPVQAPSPATLFGGLALRDGTLLLAGLRGKVLRSAAPGADLEAISTPVDASLFAGVQQDDGAVVLAGAAGQLLASRDAGETFKLLPLPARFPFSGIVAAPDRALVLVGQRGLLRVEAMA